MAWNVSPARDPRLRELADGALRHAARTARSGERVDAVVREMIRRVCEVAHERELRAEQLLLLLKQAWRELPEGRRLPPRADDDVLARAITVCIDEYYAGGGGR